MRKEYKELFDKLSPVRGDDELLKAVLDRKAENNMGTKRFSKNIFIPVIAAAVLGATAVGASAAYQWSQAQAVQKVFENKGNVETDIPKYDLNKLGGKALNDVIDGDGFTLKTIGITADDHTAYMFYDIVFDEGIDYSLGEKEEWVCSFTPRLEVEWIKEYWGLNLENRDKVISPHMSGYGGLLGSEGNVLHMYSAFTLSGITLPGKTLNYDYLSLNRYNTATQKSSDSFYGGDVSLAVDIDFVTSKPTVINPNTQITLPSGETGMFKIIEVTPFTLATDIDWENYESGIDFNNDVVMVNTNGKFSVEGPTLDRLMASLKIKFKDGTVKDINAFAMNYGSAGGALRLAWEYPVDVDQIDSVTLGDVEVKF